VLRNRKKKTSTHLLTVVALLLFCLDYHSRLVDKCYLQCMRTYINKEQ